MSSEEITQAQVDLEEEARYKTLYRDINFLLRTLKINSPLLHGYIIESAGIAVDIGAMCGEDSDDFVLACYCANIGMLATDGIEFKGILDQSEKDFFKKHISRSEDQLVELGFDMAASIVKHHHERPDGSGYIGKITYPSESNYIRIADEFCSLKRVSPTRMHRAYDSKEAARIVLEPFKGYKLIVSEENIALIKTYLESK